MGPTDFHYMDPRLLVGLAPTELRRHEGSLDDLVKTDGLDERALINRRAAAAAYEDQPGKRQLR